MSANETAVIADAMAENYQAFVTKKLAVVTRQGISGDLSVYALKPHQSDLTAWALRRGCAAIFADTGLGKSRMQVAWADVVCKSRPGSEIIILAPLAVAGQTVEDRYNADGKSCHITDDLPAGMKLYADPPVAAPVRPNDSELEMIARAHGTGGWQTLGDMVTFARAIESAVLRANGFKLEGEQ